MELWRTGQFDLMVLSGGIVAPRYIQTRPHAHTMKEWVINQPGAPDNEQILIDEMSRDSYENTYFSYDRIKTAGYNPIIQDITLTIVSEIHHARRLRITFQKGIGWQSINIAPVNYKLSFGMCLLEYALYIMHAVDPEGIGPLAKLNRWLRTRSCTWSD